MSNIRSGKSFNDIEDVDDSTFLNHPRHGQSGYVLGGDNAAQSWEMKRQQLLDERRKIEEQTLQSTKTSLGLLYETEKIGVHTAEELLHQREQLNNVNDKLDSINSIMRTSQKHLTQMKSIFGGFKNYFSRGGTNDTNSIAPKHMSTSASESRLQSTVDSIKTDSDNVNSQLSHPALKNKSIDTTGFYHMGTSSVDPQSEISTTNLSAHEIRSRQVDQQIDQNLTDMSMGIGRLKDLALGLGNEIDSQNQLLDTLGTKSERAQDTIANQNRQMKRILKS